MFPILKDVWEDGCLGFDSGIKGSKIQIFFEKHTESMVLRDKEELEKLLNIMTKKEIVSLSS